MSCKNCKRDGLCPKCDPPKVNILSCECDYTRDGLLKRFCDCCAREHNKGNAAKRVAKRAQKRADKLRRITDLITKPDDPPLGTELAIDILEAGYLKIRDIVVEDHCFSDGSQVSA